MNEKFKELLMKKAKEGKTISPEQAKEKMSVLDELSGMMGEQQFFKTILIGINAAERLRSQKEVSYTPLELENPL